MTETQDVVQKPPRTEPAKTTLPQPGKPIPSRAYPGALIVVEGTDGSGKSTQLYLLKRWLEIGGYRLHFTEWNSSPLVKSATRRGKQKRLLTPTTFSLLHAADFPDRSQPPIMPLRLPRLRPRRRPRLLPPLAPQSLSFRSRPRHYLLFPRPTRSRCRPHSQRPSQTQILRSRHGPRPLLRAPRKFQTLPGPHPRGVRQNGGHRQLRCPRWHSPREQTPKTDARHRRLQNRAQALRTARSGSGIIMPDPEKDKEKEKEKSAAASPAVVAEASAKSAAAEVDSAQCFFGESLLPLHPPELNRSLIVIQGIHASHPPPPSPSPPAHPH